MSQEFDGAALGTRIKLLREMRGMTLRQVADAAGLNLHHVWRLEQGQLRNPTVNTVWRLARGLTARPAILLGLDDSMPQIESMLLKIAGIVDRETRRSVADWDSAEGIKP